MRKTLVNVYLDKTFGYGDYVRGCIYLAQLSAENGLDFEFDVSQHPICFFMVSDKGSENTEVLRVFHGEMSAEVWKQKLDDFAASDETRLRVSTNFFYDNSKITKDLKGAVNSKLQIRPEYYRKVDELLPLSRYNVLHVRCSDENGIDLPRIVQSTRMLQLPKNTVVLSSDFNTKKKLQEMFGFHMCETRPAHTAYSTNVAELESVLIDYIILSRSASTYCFSFYGHGSGFSEQCSMLHDVAYTVCSLETGEERRNELVARKQTPFRKPVRNLPTPRKTKTPLHAIRSNMRSIFN